MHGISLDILWYIMKKIFLLELEETCFKTHQVGFSWCSKKSDSLILEEYIMDLFAI